MATGDPSAAAAGDVSPDTFFSPAPTLSTGSLHEALAALSQAFESGDIAASDDAAAAVSGVLDAAAADGGDADDAPRSDAAARVSEELLREVHAFLSSPSSNQMAIEALSLVLLKPVAKLGALVGSCSDIAATIIKFFVTNCSPRDMLSIFCEALDIPMELPDGPAYFVLLLNGLAEVLALIQRRHIEQVKVALPAVLKVMHATVSECDEEHGKASVDIFNASLGIGNAIQKMCKAMVNKNKDLCAALGLYSLQNIALISQTRQRDLISACGSIVLQYFQFLKFCGFTYVGILTGNDATAATAKLSKEDDADFVESFSFAMDGATLSVVWTYMYDDMSNYAGEELELALKEIQENQMKKWEAINTLRYVLSSVRYPWVVKSHCIDLLLTLTVQNHIEEINDDVDFTSYAPRTFATLKAIESVMMGAPEALMRKKAFGSLKKASVLREDFFATAIFLDLVREEVLRESRQPDKDCADGLNHGKSPPWASHALDLVELILRPPEGGPPCLPDQSEQVLSALNLLRFILIIDSKGSRLGKLLCKEALQKVHSEWLIPLRPIVAGIQSESEKDGSEIADQISCSLNPVQLVLYRCIELVEEKMKNF
ncbi:hypothetical protein EJB05_08794 [Eragrostis curvula]|uniref:Aberrant root formation protein 4 n=1 Tax=Eragrostis curvula TaxID=38414 RepID=A0A5J9W0W4_9POAL|nr:hypothetical protein EJB05_08794 [Eragrostis curvula]